MNDEGLVDAAAANPFRLPRLHPGIGSPEWRRESHPLHSACALGDSVDDGGPSNVVVVPRNIMPTRSAIAPSGCTTREWPKQARRRSSPKSPTCASSTICEESSRRDSTRGLL